MVRPRPAGRHGHVCLRRPSSRIREPARRTFGARNVARKRELLLVAAESSKGAAVPIGPNLGEWTKEKVLEWPAQGAVSAEEEIVLRRRLADSLIFRQVRVPADVTRL